MGTNRKLIRLGGMGTDAGPMGAYAYVLGKCGIPRMKQKDEKFILTWSLDSIKRTMTLSSSSLVT